MKWERDTAKYSNGSFLFIGEVAVAHVWWSNMTKDDTTYRGTLLLPITPESRFVKGGDNDENKLKRFIEKEDKKRVKYLNEQLEE